MSFKGNLAIHGMEGDSAGAFTAIGKFFSKLNTNTEATAGAVTYAKANFVNGLILRDPAGGARSDVSPTATNILTEIPGAAIGSAFILIIRNTADAAETITLTAGTGVTLSGTMTIAQNNTKVFVGRVTATATPAVTIYSIGTFVH